MSDEQKECIGKGSEKGECEELYKLKEAARKVLEGFDRGVFLRNTKQDHESKWAIELYPYVMALKNLMEGSDYVDAGVREDDRY